MNILGRCMFGQVSNLMAAKMLEDVTNMEGKTDEDGASPTRGSPL